MVTRTGADRISFARRRLTRATTKARKKDATTAIGTVTGTHKNSAPTTTRAKTTVPGLAIARCTAVTIAKDSRTDTKMGIEAIDPKSDWIVRARSRGRALHNRVNFDCFNERQGP